MIIKGTQEVINEYFKSEALSQSELKTLFEGPEAFQNYRNKKSKNKFYYEEDSESLILGSAVDTLLTQTEEDFYNKYFISSIEKKPGNKLLSIIHQVADIIIKSNIEIKDFDTIKDIIINCAREQEYYPNWKDKAILEKINTEENLVYLDNIIKSNGKQIISIEQFEIIKTVEQNIRNKNPQLFDNKYEHIDTIYILFQIPIYFSYKGIECRALPDIVVVNFNDECITIYDIKTMSGDTHNFYSNFKKYRYDFQAAFYKLAIEKGNFGLPEIDEKINDKFKIITGKYIVESTTNPGNPLIYFTDSKVINDAINGTNPLITEGIDQHNLNLNTVEPIVIKQAILGINDAIYLYNFYNRNNWEKHIDSYQEVLKITTFGVRQSYNNRNKYVQ